LEIIEQLAALIDHLEAVADATAWSAFVRSEVLAQGR